MASLARAWMAALSLLGALALSWFLLCARRSRLARREALVRQVREQLLLGDGAGDAA